MDPAKDSVARVSILQDESELAGAPLQKTLLWLAPQIFRCHEYVGELLQFLSRGQRYPPGFCVGVDQV